MSLHHHHIVSVKAGFMNECFLGRQLSLSPDKLQAMRTLVHGRALAIIDESPVRLDMAAENVDVLERIRFTADDEEGSETAAFMCATIGVHVDTGNVPRWNTIAYLGTLDQRDDVDVEHVLYVQAPPNWRETNDGAGIENGTDPLALGGTTHSLVLKPGDVVLLDVEYPHWFMVRVNGEEMGDATSKSPLFGGAAKALKGTPLKTITALFLATACDDAYLTDDALHRVYDSIELVDLKN